MASGSGDPPPPPPPPPPAGGDAPPSDPASSLLGTCVPLPKANLDPATLSSALLSLERLRSLRAESQSCALFASSLLAHPLGARGTVRSVSGQVDDLGIGARWMGDAVVSEARAADDAMTDGLHPAKLPGGTRDAWAALARSARALDAASGDDDGGADGAGDAAAGTVTSAMIESELARDRQHRDEEYTLTNGQLSAACRKASLRCALEREAAVEAQLDGAADGGGYGTFDRISGQVRDSLRARAVPGQAGSSSSEIMEAFYDRVRKVKEYHGSNDGEVSNASSDAANPLGGLGLTGEPGGGVGLLTGRKRRHGHPLADGYDVASLISAETSAVRGGEVYSPEEMYGKYLDLVLMYQNEVRNMRAAFAVREEEEDEGDKMDVDGDEKKKGEDGVTMPSYLDFLNLLSRGLNSLDEKGKLKDRRKYARFLREMETYLRGFLDRTVPFLDVQGEVVGAALRSFEDAWAETGGVEGWECRPAEASMAKAGKSSGEDGQSDKENGKGESGIDLSGYKTADELAEAVDGDALKSELARLGMKCGGTVKDRAARLFLTKDTPLDKLPAKVFAKKKGAGKKGPGKAEASAAGGAAESTSDRRIDIARSEAVVTSLLDQLRPTLEATRRRAERRSTQTENERDREVDEEVNGPSLEEESRRQKKQKGANGDDSDSEDEEDAPIYNPKNVPLGWDGKPIPYWLFKLHGLNHFYPCEICGGIMYRGRRNFEKHFTESRHAYGMRCLGIPNTKHFHGVTKIKDAQNLWERLRGELEGNTFDMAEEEEYEDSHGNVLKRSEYEDLARQGLL